MRKLGKIILWTFAGIGALTLSVVLAVVAFTASVRDDVPPLPDVAVLSLDWNKPLEERAAALPLFEKAAPATVLDTVTAIERAATVPEVKALAVRLGQEPIAFSRAQDLADAVRLFRQSGKPAFAFAADLASFGDGTPETMLAAAFDEVWLRPSGGVGLTGVALEVPYFADALEEIGVEAEFEQRHEYKGGADPFTKRFMPAPVRASLTAIAEGLLDQAVASIASDRELDAAAVRALVDRGPLLAREAEAAGLVDKLGYAADFEAAVEAAVGADAQPVGAERLLASTAAPADMEVGATRVAVVFGIGPIGVEADQSPFGDPGFDTKGILETFARIEEEGGYDAVLFRVESPGGAYGPSDAVWAAVKRLRAAGTPVVVSMGRVAASGGYFVSMAADRIVAQPATVTGSIGVYGGGFDVSRLWSKLGVRWQFITAGANAGMWSTNRGFDPAERDRLATAMDFVYADFTEKVAEARGFDAEKLNDVARGRVWTGAAAREVGLIDALGGFDAAQDQIRDVLGLAPDAALDLTVLPEPKQAWEAVLEALQSGDFPLAASRLIAAAVEERVVARAEAVLGDLSVLEAPRGVLSVPPFRLRRTGQAGFSP